MRVFLLFISIMFSSVLFGQERADECFKSEHEASDSKAPLIKDKAFNISDLIAPIKVPVKKNWFKRNLDRKAISKKRTKKSRLYMDWDWAGVLLIVLGILILFGGFGLIILTTIWPWWWFLIGIAAIAAGITLAMVGATIIGGKDVGLGVVAGVALATIIGLISLGVWAVVELVLWLIG